MFLLSNISVSWDLPWEPQWETSLSKLKDSVAISLSLQRKEGGEKKSYCVPSSAIYLRGQMPPRQRLIFQIKSPDYPHKASQRGWKEKDALCWSGPLDSLKADCYTVTSENTPAKNRPSYFLIFFVRLGKSQPQPLLLYFGTSDIDPSWSQIPQSCRNIKEKCTTLHQNSSTKSSQFGQVYKSGLFHLQVDPN